MDPQNGEPRLTHLTAGGEVRMVDVTEKEISARMARARAVVTMNRETLELMLGAGLEKGDVFSVARIAGIMGAKKAPELIPLCHPIPLTGLEVEVEADPENPSIIITVTVRTADRTGVEMEALVGAAIAALTVYDMGKSVDRAMRITEVSLLEKSGGRSGHFVREETPARPLDGGYLAPKGSESIKTPEGGS